MAIQELPSNTKVYFDNMGIDWPEFKLWSFDNIVNRNYIMRLINQ